MKFNPKVTIIIPVYNGENYVAEAIESALAQTYKNLEIIVVDDGSKDKTGEIVKKYGNKVKYFRKDNGGTSTALNLGIKNMKGNYFSWLSHDDMYYPDKIKRQIEELSLLENKNTIMMSDLDGINENYEKIYETKYINHIKAYPPREMSNIHPIIYNQTHGCTLLIPKVCFDKVGLFDETELVAQDFEFFYRAFLEFPHKLVPEVLVTARDSSNRQGIRSKAKGNVEYSRLFIKIIENLSDEDYNLLAPSKLDFYKGMEEFFAAAGYSIAQEYLRKKTKKNVQISSYDLIGRRFNGHDLHMLLREENIDSSQIVLYKQSEDLNTYNYNFFEDLATKKLLTKKLLINSEIIHFHLIHNIIDINFLPIISNMIPSVITLHDCFFLAGHCVHHFDCEKWQTTCNDCPYLDVLFPVDKDISTLNFVMKYNAIKNSQISAIVSSKWMLNKVEKSSIWKGKKVYYLPFGLDTQKFKPENSSKYRDELGINREDFVIFFRAEKDDFKGIDVITKALETISGFEKITIITVGTKGLLSKFESKTTVIDLGWVKEEEKLIKIYQCSDIFLMPSKQETFGLMALEAMSCGKMVLAINEPGSALPDIIDAPNCGIAPEKDNFTKELCRLIYNKDEVILRGTKSREYVLKNHKKEDYVKGMIKIYDEIIKDHKIDERYSILLAQLRTYSDNIGIEMSSNDPTILIDNQGEIDKSQIEIQNSPSNSIAVKKQNINIKKSSRELFRKYLPIKIRKKMRDVLLPLYWKIKNK